MSDDCPNELSDMRLHDLPASEEWELEVRRVLLAKIESLRAQLAEYRAAITALDCWMEKHDPKARSDYWRWRHRYYAILTDARGDHE